MEPRICGEFDAIFDRGSFVAINVSMRRKYADLMSSILKSNSTILMEAVAGAATPVLSAQSLASGGTNAASWLGCEAAACEARRVSSAESCKSRPLVLQATVREFSQGTRRASEEEGIGVRS